MSRDLILFIFNLIVAIVAIGAAFLAHPILALVVFAGGAIAYIAYVVYQIQQGQPGNIFLRFSPILVLLVVVGAMFWFWPSTLKLALYEDLNGDGLRDENEPGIPREILELVDVTYLVRKLTTDSRGEVLIEQIPRGIFRLKVRDLSFHGYIRIVFPLLYRSHYVKT